MIVAISSTGDALNAPVDIRFGRCFCFVLYDTESGVRTFEPNPYRTTGEDAALKAAQMLLDRGVRRVFAGQFGTRVEEFFSEKGSPDGGVDPTLCRGGNFDHDRKTS